MIVITKVVKELSNFEKADPKRRYYSQLSYCHVEGIPNKKVGEAHGDQKRDEKVDPFHDSSVGNPPTWDTVEKAKKSC